MMPQGARLAVADEGPMARARLAVGSLGLLIGALVVAGVAVSLGAPTDGVAHQAAERQV